MTEDTKITANEGNGASDTTNRRRSTDIPQPLDYVTRELVSEFIENPRPTSPPIKSFIKKLLRTG